jgi:hypothetical protein
VDLGKPVCSAMLAKMTWAPCSHSWNLRASRHVGGIFGGIRENGLC